MSCRRSLQQIIGMTLVLLLLAGCGTSAGKTVPPKPGASFSGAINSGDKAESGTLAFTVSENGDAILDLRTSLQSANCNDMISMGSVADFQSNPRITISEGAFEGALPAMGGMVTDYSFHPPDPFPTAVPDPMTVGKIVGHFSAPTTASGTITIYLGAMMTGGVVCELGTFDWSATGN
jgi:hypothetical protein